MVRSPGRNRALLLHARVPGLCDNALATVPRRSACGVARDDTWAAGGLVGIETQGHAIKDAALASERDPLFVALVCGSAAKVLGALLALALVRPWGRTLPRWLLLVPAWAGGVGMIAYGGIPLVVNGLMLAGLLRVPGPLDWVAIRWHFLLWDPWWTVGGTVLVAAAWSYQRRTRRRGEMAQNCGTSGTLHHGDLPSMAPVSSP